MKNVFRLTLAVSAGGVMLQFGGCAVAAVLAEVFYEIGPLLL